MFNFWPTIFGVVGLMAVVGGSFNYSYKAGYRDGSAAVVIGAKEIEARQQSFNEGFELGRQLMFFCSAREAGQVGYQCWQRTPVAMSPEANKENTK